LRTYLQRLREARTDSDASQIQKTSGIAPMVERSGKSCWVHPRLPPKVPLPNLARIRRRVYSSLRMGENLLPVPGPLIFPGMETIDVTAVGEDMFSLNHDAYSGVRSVLDDIGRLVISGIHPPNLRSPQIRGVPRLIAHNLESSRSPQSP
jgi:hypothetical protein